MERFADEFDLTQFRIDQLTALAVAAMRDLENLVSGRDHCLDCGDIIPEKCLIYVPNATRCAPCQDREERLGRGFVPGALVDKPQARRSVETPLGQRGRRIRRFAGGVHRRDETDAVVASAIMIIFGVDERIRPQVPPWSK